MVPPTLFISGGVAVLQLCKEIYVRFRGVKRFRKDCEKLAHFVHRIEAFITETEDETDMTEPGWKEAFSALHEALEEVVVVFEDCAKYGMLRSMINADDLNLRLNAISQRLMLALQLIPIQKAKATDRRLVELKEIQLEIRSATFVAVRAAEEQSAQLKRLLDQSRMDASKTQEMLAQVMALLQADPSSRGACSAAAAAGPGPTDGADEMRAARAAAGAIRVDPQQLEAEVADLRAEQERAQRDKNIVEEQYLEQVIAAISAMEAQLSQDTEVPEDLRCPITYQLLRDPVILVDSHQTYERAAIEEWLGRGNRKDPVTGIQLASAALLPNVLVRKMAQEWLQNHPQYEQQQQQQQSMFKAATSEASDQHFAAFEKAAAGATKAKSSCGGKGAVQDDAGDCTKDADELFFKPNPKTAAILAASVSQGITQLPDATQDKLLAQQAYARAVAAAAEAEARTQVVASALIAAPTSPTGAFAAGGAGTDAVVDGGGSRVMSTVSVETADGSSITLAREISSRSLPSLSSGGPSGGATQGDAPPQDTVELRVWPHAAAQQQQAPLQQQQQQQAQATSPRGSALRKSQSARGDDQQQAALQRVSFASATEEQRFGPRPHQAAPPSGRQERAAAAAAAAGAFAQQRGDFSLDQLHATLGRAAETRYQMTRRHNTQEAAEEVLARQQQLQQQRMQQQEQAYLQTHMQKMVLQMSASPPASPTRQRHIQQLAAAFQVAPGSDFQPPYDQGQASTFMPPAPPLSSTYSGTSSLGVPSAPLASTYSGSSSVAVPSAPPFPTSPSMGSHSAFSSRAAAPELQPPPAMANRAPSEAGSSASRTSSTWSLFKGMGGKKKKAADADANFDDAASVSSAGSASSRKSVGKSLKGAFKGLGYTMIYDDKVC